MQIRLIVGCLAVQLCNGWSHLYQLKLMTGAQPKNITRVYLRLREIADVYINNNVQADYQWPSGAIQEAKLTGGVYPTLVPYQVGPLPKIRQDVICNPEIFAGGCTTLGGVGRRIGDRIVARWDRSAAGQTQPRFANLSENIEHRLTKGLETPVMADKLEGDPAAEMLMEIGSDLLSPLVLIEPESLWLQLLGNITDNFFGALLRIDRHQEEKNEQKLMQWKVYAAFQCRMSNGRLPNCDALANVTMPNLPIYRDSPIVEEGFYLHIYVWGFNFACMFHGGCVAGTGAVQPENFDGAYTFQYVDQNGFPVYMKEASFRDFGSVTSLWLWQGVRRLHPREPILSGYGHITPNAPDYYVATSGAKAPFALFLGDSTPNACSYPRAFPICTSGSDRWSLGRNKGAGCGGMAYRNFCLHTEMSPLIMGPTNSSDATITF